MVRNGRARTAPKERLAPGLLADVIVVNADVETTPAAEFSTIKPVVTICDGRITYEG